jgi:mRNA-degrading endonuclease toxin of MazEF toxin-antitoxin module
VKRGELYRVYKGTKNDPKKHRVFLIVSRQTLIDHVGALSDVKMEDVNTALRIALAVE